MTPSDLRSTLELLARNHRWTWQHRVVALFRRPGSPATPGAMRAQPAE